MRRGLFPISGIGACLVAALLSQPAHAQAVTIELKGEIPVTCSLDAPSTQINVGTLSARGTIVIPFWLRCNAPFQFALSSRYGALITPEVGLLRPAFTTVVPYDASVRIPTTAGTMSGSCASTALRAGNLGCAYPPSPQGIAVEGESSLTVSWNVEKVPVAGTYSDVVALRVVPKI